MRKKDIKTMLIVLLPMFIIGFLALFISFYSYNKKNTSLIVNGANFWQFKNGKWYNYVTIGDLDWKKYNVYFENKYINNYYVTITNNKTYFFNDNDDSYDVDSPYIAIRGDNNVKPIIFKENDFISDDINIVNSYLKKIKINYNGDYSEQKKYVTDVNGDGKEDYVYVVSNELYNDSNLFYLVFAYCNGKFINIDIQQNSSSFIHYDLSWILNIRNNGYYSIVLSEPKEYDEKYYLYQYTTQSRQFDLIFDN